MKKIDPAKNVAPTTSEGTRSGVERRRPEREERRADHEEHADPPEPRPHPTRMMRIGHAGGSLTAESGARPRSPKKHVTASTSPSEHQAPASPGRRPRRRLRRHRRRAQAEGRRRRRRARRQARLPHVPAAPLPARHRPARDRRRRASAARPLPRAAERRRPPGRRDGRSTSPAREVHFAEMAPLAYDYLVLALGAAVNFFGTEGAAEHAFPMYTLADAVRLKEHVLRRVGGGGQGPGARRGRRAQRRRRRRRPDRRRERRRAGRALPRRLRQGLLRPVRRRRRASPSSRPARSSCRCSRRTSAPTRRRRSRSAASRCSLGELVASVSPTRVTLKSGHGARRRTRSSGAPACRRARSPTIARARAREGQPGRRPSRTSAVGGHPEVFAVGDIAWITDTKTKRVLPQLGSVALQSGEQAGENIARLHRGQGDRSRSSTTTRARWRRSAAARRSCSSTAGGR